MTVNTDQKFLSIEDAIEVVQELGFVCSEVRMRRLARERELPFFKEGRRLYIARQALLDHYAKRQQQAQAA